MPSDLVLAVDLGGTKVESALVDASGRIIGGSRFRRPTGACSDSDQLSRSVTEVGAGAIGAVMPGTTLLGIGIGAAGPIRQDDGLVSPLNLPAWRDFPLTELVARAAPDHDVTLRMDGLCITLAEHWIGAARGSSNHMGMVVSTGIGGGLILGGRTVSGPTGNAGHIGHVEIAGFTDDCACGGHGCLEAVASGPRSVAWARAQGWNGSTGEELAESYVAGDGIAHAAVTRAGRAIGRAIGSVTSLVDLDLVTIGGGFSRITPELFKHIRTGIDEHTSFGFVRKVSVLPSALSDDGPLIGAAALVHRADILD